MTTDRCPPPDWDDVTEQNVGAPEPIALAERIAYAMSVAAAPGSAEVTPEETRKLRRLCHELELPDGATERVLEAAFTRRGEMLDPASGRTWDLTR